MIINKKMQRMELNKFILVSNKYNSEENFHKIDKIKAIIDELSVSLGMEAIERIMETHKHYRFGVKFLEFLNLHRKLDPKTINKELSLSLRSVENWYRKYPPRPIRTLLNIYFNGYHKISKKDLAYLFGWGFGDGGINFELGYYFVCGKREDLLKIKEYLKINIPKIPIVIEKNDGHSIITLHNGNKRVVGGINTWILYVRDSSFCKLLYSLSLPKGNKVLQKIEIPNWIKNGDKDVKKAFLNTLFEGELQKHKVQYNVKRNKIDICPITFSMNKVEEYKDNLFKFLNEIRNLLTEFDIKTTKLDKFKPEVIRKDNKRTYSTRFYISISAINTINFSKVIDYNFNKDKKEALLIAVREANNKLERMSKQVEKYSKALEFYANGKSIYKIAKELNTTYCTVRHWVKTKEHLPILLNTI